MAKKEALLEQIRQARASLLDALAGLPDDTMLRPYVVGIWSIKDVLAHLTIWQSELITALSQLDKPTHVPNIVAIDDIDEFNDDQYRANVRRSLAVILEDFHGVHKYLLQAVEDIDEKTLTNTRRFPWLEGESLEYLIAENGYLHELEHADEIRQWRIAQGL